MSWEQIVRHLRASTASVDSVDVWFVLEALSGFAAFLTWTNQIVRAIRGEATEDDWKTTLSSAALMTFWALTSGGRVREATSLKSTVSELHGVARDAAEQEDLRDQRAIERDQRNAQQQERVLRLTKWLVVLAALTLTAAIITLAVTIA